MSELKVKTRLIQKHALEAVWNQQSTFVPFQGELVVYDAEIDENGVTLQLPSNRTQPFAYERFKIGDGVTTVNLLPFVIDKEKLDATITHAPQSLSEAEAAQARSNIGAISMQDMTSYVEQSILGGKW